MATGSLYYRFLAEKRQSQIVFWQEKIWENWEEVKNECKIEFFFSIINVSLGLEHGRLKSFQNLGIKNELETCLWDSIWAWELWYILWHVWLITPLFNNQWIIGEAMRLLSLRAYRKQKFKDINFVSSPSCLEYIIFAHHRMFWSNGPYCSVFLEMWGENMQLLCKCSQK